MSSYFVIASDFRQQHGVFVVLLCVVFGLSTNDVQAQQVQTQGAGQAQSRVQTQPSLEKQLDDAKAAVQLRPDDARAHYAYGEMLRKCGKYRQAASEYLDAADLDSTLYVAFHQIAQIKCDPSQIDEAYSYLSELDEERPNDLMLKIALSELLERKAEYYKAARALIDVSYSGKLPPKLTPRIKARIHYLLAKSRQEQNEGSGSLMTAPAARGIEDDENGGLPPPLPENMPSQPLKSNDSGHVTEGTGHSTLLQ